MKKIISIFFTILIIFPLIGFKNFVVSAKAETESPNEIELSISSPSVILMEYSTGKILYQKEIKKKMYPASMTKMMAIYLILESIKNGSHSFDEIVTVSTLASSMGGSQIFLKENERMSFEDLFKALTIASANDAVTALAEHTYGSLETFINEMNARAKQFGMNDTNFVNVTGFHDINHYTTTYDMAILARKLLQDYQDTLLKYTSIYDTYLRQDTASPFWLVNTNRMLKYYQGMDGLKTGYTSDSGFNLTATAIRNNMRLISVVMGGETSKKRNQDTSTLLDFGFNNYKVITLYKKGEVITNFSFSNAKEVNTPLTTKEDVNYLVRKNENVNKANVKIDIINTDAPVDTSSEIGKISINDVMSYGLYPAKNVEALSFKDILIKFWKAIFI